MIIVFNRYLNQALCFFHTIFVIKYLQTFIMMAINFFSPSQGSSINLGLKPLHLNELYVPDFLLISNPLPINPLYFLIHSYKLNFYD